MKPELQRIAIAEACGWTAITSDFIGRPSWSARGGFDDCEIPDYLNDLNAMHEAENLLTDDQSITYWMELNRMKSSRGNRGASFWASCHAPAAKRAEAFLRTLGKWVES